MTFAAKNPRFNEATLLTKPTVSRVCPTVKKPRLAALCHVLVIPARAVGSVNSNRRPITLVAPITVSVVFVAFEIFNAV